MLSLSSPCNGEGSSQPGRRPRGSRSGCKALPAVLTVLTCTWERPFQSLLSAPWSVLLLLRRKSQSLGLLLIRSGLSYKSFQCLNVILRLNITTVSPEHQPQRPHMGDAVIAGVFSLIIIKRYNNSQRGYLFALEQAIFIYFLYHL